MKPAIKVETLVGEDIWKVAALLVKQAIDLGGTTYTMYNDVTITATPLVTAEQVVDSYFAAREGAYVEAEQRRAVSEQNLIGGDAFAESLIKLARGEATPEEQRGFAKGMIAAKFKFD